MRSLSKAAGAPSPSAAGRASPASPAAAASAAASASLCALPLLSQSILAKKTYDIACQTEDIHLKSKDELVARVKELTILQSNLVDKIQDLTRQLEETKKTEKYETKKECAETQTNIEVTHIKSTQTEDACTQQSTYFTRIFRRLFTRHGQHLNGQGKAALCYKLLSAIESLRREQCKSSSKAATANQQLTQLNGVPHNNFGREMPLPVERAEPEPVTLPFDTYADAVKSDNLRRTLTSERHQPESSPPAAARDVGSGDPDSVIGDRRMSTESVSEFPTDHRHFLAVSQVLEKTLYSRA
ncbi:hypothetical protein J6590_100309 [Homalodisca vitripennis]|nr:hypothetical protein J6590_100309 [Homalodisca vitripennis]